MFMRVNNHGRIKGFIMRILSANTKPYNSQSQTFKGSVANGSFKIFCEAYEKGTKYYGKEFDMLAKAGMKHKWLALKKFVAEKLHPDTVLTLQHYPNKTCCFDEIKAVMINDTLSQNSGYIQKSTSVFANKDCVGNLDKLSKEENDWFVSYLLGTGRAFLRAGKSVEEFGTKIKEDAKTLIVFKRPKDLENERTCVDAFIKSYDSAFNLKVSTPPQ